MFASPRSTMEKTSAMRAQVFEPPASGLLMER